jgi:hypothetical protein
MSPFRVYRFSNTFFFKHFVKTSHWQIDMQFPQETTWTSCTGISVLSLGSNKYTAQPWPGPSAYRYPRLIHLCLCTFLSKPIQTSWFELTSPSSVTFSLAPHPSKSEQLLCLLNSTYWLVVITGLHTWLSNPGVHTCFLDAAPNLIMWFKCSKAPMQDSHGVFHLPCNSWFIC